MTIPLSPVQLNSLQSPSTPGSPMTVGNMCRQHACSPLIPVLGTAVNLFEPNGHADFSLISSHDGRPSRALSGQHFELGLSGVEMFGLVQLPQ
jgi:hypothetical protein